MRKFSVLAACGLVAVTLSACAYVERERPREQAATVVVPQSAPAVVAAPAQAVTVRPAF